MAKTTLWVEYYAKQVRDGLNNGDATVAKDMGLAAFKTLVDALYKATRKRNRRDGSGERAALFDIKAQIRSVYPSLSFDAKPSTVAKFVKRLVDDLGNARRAYARMAPVVSGTYTEHGWKADPEPAPPTQKSSPGEVTPVQFPVVEPPSRIDSFPQDYNPATDGSFGSDLRRREREVQTGSAETPGVCAGPVGHMREGVVQVPPMAEPLILDQGCRLPVATSPRLRPMNDGAT